MLYSFITVILAVIVTEAVSALLVESEFFKPMRAWLFKKGEKSRALHFVHEALDCCYCTSVWVGFVASMVLVDFSFINPYVGWFVAWLTVHRLATIMHYSIDKINNTN